MGQKYNHTQLLEVEKHGGSFQLPQNSRRGQRMGGEGKGRKERSPCLIILSWLSMLRAPQGILTPATTFQASIPFL